MSDDGRIAFDIDQFMANADKAEAMMNRTLATGMHQCITCKWWTPAKEGNKYEGRFGVCHRFPTWGLLETEPLNSHVTDDAKAFVPGSALSAESLVTTPDFGCVQHEPRDEPEDAK